MITAREVHDRFKHLPGSEYIASENAIAGLMSLLRRHRPKRILEIGSGIGTLTYAIVSTMDEVRPEYRLVMVENDRFCATRLPVNLGEKFQRGTLIGDVSMLPADAEFDLIIVDGGDATDGRYLKCLAPNGIVFVEGYRAPQRRIIETTGLPYTRAMYRSMHIDQSAAHHLRNPDGGTRWGGGYWVYRFEPTRSERVRYFVDHLWHGLLVTKRRRLKLLRLSASPHLKTTEMTEAR